MSFIAEKNLDKSFLDNIEKIFNFSLPKPYSNFLSKFGGFYISHPNYIEFDASYLDDPIVSIEKLFGINLFKVNDDLLYEIEDYVNAIIIGGDAGSNFFLLDKITGQILYWDKAKTYDYIGQSYNKDVLSYKNEDDNEDNSPSIFLLFNSFAELEAEIFKSMKDQESEIVKKKHNISNIE